MLTEHKLEILTVSIEEKETKTEAGKVVGMGLGFLETELRE